MIFNELFTNSIHSLCVFSSFRWPWPSLSSPVTKDQVCKWCSHNKLLTISTSQPCKYFSNNCHNTYLIELQRVRQAPVITLFPQAETLNVSGSIVYKCTRHDIGRPVFNSPQKTRELFFRLASSPPICHDLCIPVGIELVLTHTGQLSTP